MRPSSNLTPCAFANFKPLVKLKFGKQESICSVPNRVKFDRARKNSAYVKFAEFKNPSLLVQIYLWHIFFGVVLLYAGLLVVFSEFGLILVVLRFKAH